LTRSVLFKKRVMFPIVAVFNLSCSYAALPVFIREFREVTPTA
jgi:hypothetical protein